MPFVKTKIKTEIKNKDNLVLGKGQTKGLDNTSLTADTEYSVNFPRSETKLCSSVHYNGSNTFLFRKIHQFKAKDSERKKYHLCLVSILKDFPVFDMKMIGLNNYIDDFSVDFNIFDTTNIIDIHKYLMKKHDIKQCLDFLKKCLLYY